MDTAGIGTPETINIATLNNFHKNPRVGNVEEIAASLAANGQYKPLVVNRGTYTNRPMEVLAGNHTLKAMRLLTERNADETRFREADCWVVDVDDDRATRIVLADNRTADLGSYDDESLFSLLDSIDHDLDGTGYDYDDLENLHAKLEEIEEPPLPTPAPAPGAQDSSNQAPAADTSEENDTAGDDGRVTNVGASAGQTQAIGGYADQPTRMMILHFPIDQFIWVQEKMGEYCDEHEETDGSNAKALLLMLEGLFNESAPTAEAEEEERDNEED